MSPLTDTMIEAAVAAGHERNPDFNGARQEGVGRFQVTQRDGLRCSAAVAYLHPAMERPNLDVITGATGPRGSLSTAIARSASRSPAAVSAAGDPRRARGHPVRGRLPVAGAADAVGDRAGRRTSS